MNLQEAQQLSEIANRPAYKLFIEWAKIRQEPEGDYYVVIEPIFGEQQSFSDAEQALWALVRLVVEASQANDRYFTLSEGGVQKECDRKTWEKDLTNREKTLVRITCSPEIEASIAFLGHAWFIIHMDEEVKLWTAGFCLIAKHEHFGGPLFKSFEQAKAFVDRFIALGCPAFESLQWTHFLAEFNDV